MKGKSLLISLTLIVLGLLTWQLRWVLLVFFGAIVVSVALDVIIQNIHSLIRLPRKLSLVLALLIISIIGSFVFQLLVPELIAQISELRTLIPTLTEKIKTLISDQPILVLLQQSIPEQFDWEGLEPLGRRILGFAGGAANSIIQILLISLLSILLTLDPKSHRKILIAATPKPFRQDIDELLGDCRIALGGWLQGMTISATSIFILTWIGLVLLKVPLALLSALMCGLLTFIPTIGPTTATLLPLGISLLISPTLMFQVLILRIFLQNIEAFLITPILLNRTVKLLPTFALMSQLCLGALLGLPGVILALPLAVVLQVAMQKIIVEKVMDNWE